MIFFEKIILPASSVSKWLGLQNWYGIATQDDLQEKGLVG
jgi:hypothetical protein